MAATLTLTSATPYALKYLFAYDGTGGPGSGVALRDRAQMVADLNNASPGANPLQDYLASLTSGAFGTFGLSPRGPVLSLSVLTLDPAPNAVTASFQNVSDKMSVVAVDGSPADAIIEVRFHHTMAR